MTQSATLQVNSDRRFQECFWKLERLAWVGLGLFILAAVIGLTGKGGYFAQARVGAGNVEISYPRIARWQAPERLTIDLEASGPTRVILSQGFLSAFSVDSVTPQPLRVIAMPEGQQFEFALAPESGSKSIRFDVSPSQVSLLTDASIRVGEAPPIPFSFLVLP